MTTPAQQILDRPKGRAIWLSWSCGQDDCGGRDDCCGARVRRMDAGLMDEIDDLLELGRIIRIEPRF